VSVTVLFVVVGFRLASPSKSLGPLVSMVRGMLADVIRWAILTLTITAAYTVSLEMAFAGSSSDETDDCSSDAAVFAEGNYHHVGRMVVAIIGGGEEYVMCFWRVLKNKQAAILMLSYLFLTVVMLVNMLIAMMAKTFDREWENQESDPLPTACVLCQRVPRYLACVDSPRGHE
jgi:hypothetical protein